MRFWFLLYVLMLSLALPIFSLAQGISYVSNETGFSAANATNFNVNVPANVQLNDLLIASVSWRTTNGGINTPAGWTELYEQDNNSISTAVLYRFASSNEPASYNFSKTGDAARTAGIISAYRGVSLKSPFINNDGETGNNSTVTAPTLTTDVNEAWLVTFFTIKEDDNISLSTPSGMTRRNFVQATAATNNIAALLTDEIKATAGATGIRESTAGANDRWVAYALALRPAKIFYSYQSGAWSTANSWTKDPSGTTLLDPAVPTINDSIVILNGRVITLSANVTTANVGITIEAGAVLDLVSYNLPALSSLNGQGELRMSRNSSPAYFPTTNANAFNKAGGGTVTYYFTGGTIDLNTGITEYNNLKLMRESSGSQLYRLNHDVTIHGNLILSRTGTGSTEFRMGTSVTARSLTVAGNIEIAASCSLTVHTQGNHNISVAGNFVNNGRVRLTNQNSPDYTTTYTGGLATLTFTGAVNSTFDCYGITDLYRLVLNKGIDQTFVLTVNTNNTANFRLLGENDQGNTPAQTTTDPNPLVNKALSLRNGTIRFTANISIPSLTEGGDDFWIPLNACLWIDGGDIATTTVNNGTSYQAITISGRLRVSAGTFTTQNASGLIYIGDGIIDIEGGTTTVCQMWNIGTGRTTFRQTGGTCILNAIGEPNDGQPVFKLESVDASFQMSGGLLQISNPRTATYGGLDINVSPLNANVTGGTVEFITTGTNNFNFRSTSPFYNLVLTRTGGSGTIIQQVNPLVVLNDLSVTGNQTFNANNLNLTIGRDFTIASGSTYTPGSSTLTFNGSAYQTFSNSGTITGGLNILTIAKSDTLLLAGSAATFQVNNDFNLNQGVINDGGKTLELRSSLTINGVHTGTGNMSLTTATSRSINGNGNGQIGNINLNGPGSNTTYTLNAGLKVTGVLNFVANGGNQRILDLQQHNLLIDTNATVTNISTVRFIRTNGFQSAGGVTKVYSGNSFIFPVGTASDYTPATISLNANPTQRGSITVKPVTFEHPSVTITGRSLAYYWRVSQSNFVMGAAKVSHAYSYVNADIVTGIDVTEAGYVAARFDVSNNGWVPGTITDVDDGNNQINFNTPTFETSIAGDFTAGDNSPDNPFGTVTVYYSRQSGPYNDINTWSTVSHSVTSPPASIPNANSIVRIGDGSSAFHTITVNANGALSGSLVIGGGSILNIGQTTGHNFGAIEGETVSGNGRLRIDRNGATYVFPAGDFGTFLGAMGGEVEYYNSTASAVNLPESPVTYRNLLLNSQSTGIITMPAAALLIYDTLKLISTASRQVYTYNTASAGGNVTIQKDLVVEGGILEFRNNGNARTWDVGGSIRVANGAVLRVQAGGTNTTHAINLIGGIVNNGTFDMWQSATLLIGLNFSGDSLAKITGTNGSASTEVGNVLVDKGSSCTTGLTVDVLGTFTAPTNNWLTLVNGYFELAKTSTTLTLTNTAVIFEIPATSCLKLSGNSSVLWVGNVASDAADLALRGTLEVTAGTLNIGNTANNNNNDIEIAPAGNPKLFVNGGILNVNGQIRRSLASTAGALYYKQGSTSTVNIYGRNHNSARGKIEVVNTGAFFEMTDSPTLNIFRGGAVTFADLYVRPDSSFVDGGTVRLKPTSVGSSQIYRFDVTYSFWNLEIEGDGGNTATVELTVNNLNVNNQLRILTNATLNTNDLNVTIGAQLERIGVYNAGTNTTRLNGNPSQIVGAMTGSNSFYNFIVGSGAALTLQLASPIRINGLFTIQSAASISDNSQEIDCRANIVNNGTHISSTNSSTNTLVLAGSVTQQISGTGSFGNLVVNNSNNVNLLGEFTINRRLTLTLGLVDLGDRKLTIGSTGEITGNFSNGRMIRTNGVLSDGGLTKNYPSGAQNFLYPLGVGARYTPARINITANGNAGTLTVKPINVKHPSTRDATEKQLNFYWQVDSTGFGGAVTATHTYHYVNSDVTGTEANYRFGRFVFPNWVPIGGVAGPVISAGDSIHIAGANYLSGGMTAGETSEFAAVSTYYSRNAVCAGGCDWTNANSWSIDGHAGAAVASPPVGVPVIIATGHTVNITANTQLAESVQLNGTAILNMNQTFAHNLGMVSGNGVIRIRATASEQFVFPGGNYASFTSNSGGTVEFYNAGNGILPTQLTYNKIVFKDASTRTQANVDWVINGDITIEAGNITNTTFNRNWEARANWINQVGSAGFVPGTGTVTFNSASTQTITGVTNFYKLAVSGGGNKNLANEITVQNQLILNSGKLYLGNFNLIMDSLATTAGTPTASAMVVQNGTGRMRKNFRASSGGFTFPIGEETAVAEYSPITVSFANATFTGSAYLTVQVIDNLNPTCTGGTHYLSRYWSFSVSGISDYSANVTGQYTNADINGVEAQIFGRMTRPSLACLNGSASNTANNTVAILSTTALNEFSGGEAPTAKPTISATLLTFENVSNTSMQLRWTKGNGERRLVLIKAGGAVDANPVDEVAYTSDSVYAQGSLLGTGNYVVYSNTDSTVLVTGLSPETTYHYAVFEYANSGIESAYRTTNPAVGSQTTWATEPTVQASVLNFTVVGATNLHLKWTNGNGTRRLVLGKLGSAVDAIPVDGTTYAADATFGNGTALGADNFVVFGSTIDSVVVTGLNMNSTYHFSVFEYNGTGGIQNYLTSSPAIDDSFTSLLGDIELWLEGGWNGTNMEANLVDSLPLEQPYSGAPWNYSGNEAVGSIPNADVVDWVLVELRASATAVAATSATVSTRKAGFLLTNGRIVALDGSSLLQLQPNAPADFYVVVYHRTHIPAMSSAHISFSGGAYRHNFKTAAGQAYGTTALVDLGGGNFGFYAGRVENTTPFVIDTADRSSAWSERNKLGYQPTDATLKGTIDAADRSIIWNNRGKTTQIP